MKETMVMNIISVVACAVAIAVACKTTGSAWPLLAFALIPRWKYYHSDDKEEKDEPEKDQTS